MRTTTPILFLLALTGCPPAGGKDDTAGIDTDPDDTDIQYESGCITVDGGGGYAKLADAITVASEGSLIELCDGTYEEAVVVDKGVTIRGATAGGVFLNGPGSDVPLTITGAGVTVENLVLESPRTAIVLDGATDAVLTAINVAAAGSWGLTTNDATATIDGLTIVQPAAGGIQISGGEIALSNTVLEYPASFGLDIADDAVVSVADSTITGTLMLSDDVSDGYAIQVEGSTLTFSGSAVAGADGIGLYAVDSDLTFTDSSISDVIYIGVFGFDSTYDFDNVAVTGSYLQGLYADGPSVSLNATTVSTVTGTSCSLTYDEWGQDGNPWCGGINIAGDVVELTDIAVSGYENYGVIVQPNDEEMATLTMTGGTVDDVGRWGAYFVYAEGTVSGLSVTNTREPELAEPCNGYIDQSAATLAVYSELAFDGVTVQGNAGWGLSALLGTATITNSTFDGNACIGFVNYQNVGSVSGTTFTNGSDSGSVYDAQGVLVLDGNTFVNNKSGAVYEYDYGTYIGRSEYSSGQGQDLVAYLSGAVYVTNNTFTSGDTSLTFSGVGEAEVTGNTWTDYESSIAYFYQMPTGTPAIFADNVVDDVVGPVVQSSQGGVEVSDVTVGTTRISDLVEYAYYEDDELIYSYSYQSSNSVFYVSGYYYDDGAGSITDMPGSIDIQDVTVASAYSTLLYAYDAEIDVSGLEAGDVGGYVVAGSWTSYSPDVEVSDVAAGRASSTAFSFSNSYADFGTVALSNVSLEGADSGGISATAIGELTLADVSLGDVSGAGLSSTSRTYDYGYTYDPDTGSYTYTYTDLDAATAVTATNVTIASSGSTGIALSGGSASFDNVTVSAASRDGVTLQGLTTASLTGVTVSAPAGIGIDLTDSYSAYSYEAGTTESIDADTVATLSGVSVTDAGSSGISVSGGTASIHSSGASTSGYDGLELSNVTADVQGNSFSDNTEYGMTCDAVTLTVCAGNTLTGNLLGAHLDCEDSCGE